MKQHGKRFVGSMKNSGKEAPNLCFVKEKITEYSQFVNVKVSINPNF